MKTTAEFRDHVWSLAHDLRMPGMNDQEHTVRKALHRLRTAFHHWYGLDGQRTRELDAIVAEMEPAIGRLNNVGLTRPILAYLDAVLADIDDGWEADPASRARTETEGGLLDVAENLLGESTNMAAVMVAGAVLENHLRELCRARGVEVKPGRGKKDPTLSSYNDSLKAAGLSDYPQARWRQVQSWTDLRNAADHHDVDAFVPGQARPMVEGVRELIESLPA